MSEQNKLKILALHGYRQSGSVFRAKTGSLRKLLKNIAELTYVTAPHQVVNIDPEGHSEPLEPTNESTTEDSKSYFDYIPKKPECSSVYCFQKVMVGFLIVMIVHFVEHEKVDLLLDIKNQLNT